MLVLKWLYCMTRLEMVTLIISITLYEVYSIIYTLGIDISHTVHRASASRGLCLLLVVEGVFSRQIAAQQKYIEYMIGENSIDRRRSRNTATHCNIAENIHSFEKHHHHFCKMSAGKLTGGGAAILVLLLLAAPNGAIPYGSYGTAGKSNNTVVFCDRVCVHKIWLLFCTRNGYCSAMYKYSLLLVCLYNRYFCY